MRFTHLILVIALISCDAQEQQENTLEPPQDVQKNEDELYPLSSSIWWHSTDGTTPISVCWMSSGWDTQKQWVKQAVQTTSWGWYAPVKFIGWGTCDSGYSGIKIKISDEGPHTVGFGTEIQNIANGMVLNFTFTNWSPSCSSTPEFCIKTIATHEFGHALGFAHEQNRPDTPSWCNDAQGGNGDLLYCSWDVSSVMNYCNPQWNNNGILSTCDKFGLWQLYGVNPAYTAALAASATSPL